MKIKKSFPLAVVLVFVLILQSNAQIGIHTSKINPQSELDIKSTKKGVLIPRMTGVERDLINTDTLLLTGQGLLIYNTDEDCFDYFNKAENRWKSLCGDAGAATVTEVLCNAAKINGSYWDNGDGSDHPLTSAEFITIPITISSPGTYVIKVESYLSGTNTYNGYYYTTAGTFEYPGAYLVTIPGAGSPLVNSQVAGAPDDLIITINGDVWCTMNNIVQDSKAYPYYTMSNAIIVGTYTQNITVDSLNSYAPFNGTDPMNNYMSVDLTEDPMSKGATYIIQTTTSNGVYFYGTGTLTGTNQTVYLAAHGRPLSQGKTTDGGGINVTVSSNSLSSSSTLTASKDVIFPTIRVVGYHNNNTAFSVSNPANASSGMLTNAVNVGPQGKIIAPAPFTNKPGAYNPVGSPYNSMGPENIRDNTTQIISTIIAPNGTSPTTGHRLGDGQPDIIVISFNITPTVADWTNYLVPFMKRGGVVIAFMQETAQINNMLQGVFGVANPSATLTASYTNYPIKLVSNSVIDGPFGNIADGTHFFGIDASFSGYFSSTLLSTLPSTVIPLAEGPNSSTISAFYSNDPSLRLVWFGDGGFLRSDSQTSTGVWNSISTSASPMSVGLTPDAPYTPSDRPNYGTPARTVSNSKIFMNIMSWAYQKALKGGYNTK